MNFNVSDSISYKIIVILLVCIVSVTGSVGYIAYAINSRKITEELVDSVTGISERLAFDLTQPLWDYTNSQIEALIETEARDEIVKNIVLWSQNGTIYMGLAKTADGRFTKLTAGDKVEKGFLTVKKEVRKGSHFLGVVELNATDLPLKKALADLVKMSVAQIVSMSIVIFFATYSGIKMIIVRPMKVILETVGRVEVGDFDVPRAPVFSGDEIGQFAKSIDRMVVSIRSLMEELAQKNRELESIIYVASHDLRSPLINILGFSQRLEESFRELEAFLRAPEPDEKRVDDMKCILEVDVPKALGFIQASGKKMDSLINGLLYISRTGRLLLKPRIINMNEMLAGVVAAMDFQIQQAGAVVEIGQMPDCFADESQINQVFSNLIDNAIKYRDAKRPLRIEITGSSSGSESVYSVADTGIGIRSEHGEKIWELFHRLEPGGPVAGEGLGLALVKRIVIRHNGRAWSESVPGEGSTFFVSLPAAPR